MGPRHPTAEDKRPLSERERWGVMVRLELYSDAEREALPASATETNRDRMSRARDILVGVGDTPLALAELAETVERLPAIARVAVEPRSSLDFDKPWQPTELARLIRAAAGVR